MAQDRSYNALKVARDRDISCFRAKHVSRAIMGGGMNENKLS